jgi:8-oxo-dGTP pyrophosphatase MutT (NUDIX family)
MVASAFLPATIHNGELKFLFGKELDSDSMPGFSDFGGGVESNEDIFDAGLREFAEETTGFLGDETQLRKMIKRNGGCLEFVHEKTKYHIHVIKLDHDDHLVKYFNASQKFIHDKVSSPEDLKKHRIFEKIEMKWFTQKEMEKNIHTFREFYQDIVKDIIIKNSKDIQTFIESQSRRAPPHATKQTTTKTKTKNPPRPAARIKQAPKG